MAVVASILDVDSARSRTTRHLNLTFSGSYATGGDSLNLTGLSNPNNLPGANAFGQNPTVTAVENVPDGYTAEIIAGSNLTNWAIKWYTASNTELPATTYPTGISNATDITIALVNRTNV